MRLFIAVLLFSTMSYAAPKFKVGDCMTIDRVIISIKVNKIKNKTYFCSYWTPWLHKYVPGFRLSFNDSKKNNVHIVKCKKERKLGSTTR